MIEKVLSKTNMLKACHQVVSNKGSAGVDGMSVMKLSAHWEKNQRQIATSVCNGRYLPQSILGESSERVSVCVGVTSSLRANPTQSEIGCGQFDLLA